MPLEQLRENLAGLRIVVLPKWFVVVGVAEKALYWTIHPDTVKPSRMRLKRSPSVGSFIQEYDIIDGKGRSELDAWRLDHAFDPLEHLFSHEVAVHKVLRVQAFVLEIFCSNNDLEPGLEHSPLASRNDSIPVASKEIL